MKIEECEQLLNKDKITMSQLNRCCDTICNAMNKACINLANTIFDSYFYKFIYYQYIELNKSGESIGKEFDIPKAVVFKYIKKYKIVKTQEQINASMMKTYSKVILEKYGVDHIGKYMPAHEKSAPKISAKRTGRKFPYKHKT